VKLELMKGRDIIVVVFFLATAKDEHLVQYQELIQNYADEIVKLENVINCQESKLLELINIYLYIFVKYIIL
jgi:hypothetical protein